MKKENSGSTAREFLKEHITPDAINLFGTGTPEFIESVVNLWMDDRDTSKFRIEEIKEYLPAGNVILDMASGCGTFVFCGLMNGYDVFGIEPENWKNRFNQLKISENNYHDKWRDHFFEAVGEKLPFKDNSFDCVSTYQTLEHVQDISKCIDEMIRVTRTGGGLHIRCPDYLSTFEGHYRLPWLPFFPRRIAKIYLRSLKRPTNGLDTLQYTSRNMIKRLLCESAFRNKVKLTIIDINKERTKKLFSRFHIPSFFITFYPLIRVVAYMKYLFRSDLGVALFVKIDSK